MHKKSFASDNYAGIHHEILNAIIAANIYHVPAYGSDAETTRATQQFKEHFGEDSEVYFVFNGTAANVLSLQAMTRSYHAVLCASTAHIQMDECGAPEKISGCKLITMPTTDGKLTVNVIKQHLARMGDQHAVQPRVISISQSTEYGTVYSPDQIRALVDFAHQNNMYLHMDGARICNAAASLNVDFRAITCDAGVDILSFGGTKIGMMMGEAVVIFSQHLSHDFQFIRKQGMQLASKMRFISAQFHALLSNDLWRRNALHANRMAVMLAEKLNALSCEKIKITQPVQANAVFVIMPETYIQALQEKFHFYIWDEKISEARLMTSFDTAEADIDDFVSALKQIIKA
jgi:threonine aldolase